jgi:hypothetical protein
MFISQQILLRMIQFTKKGVTNTNSLVNNFFEKLTVKSNFEFCGWFRLSVSLLQIQFQIKQRTDKLIFCFQGLFKKTAAYLHQRICQSKMTF